MKSQYLETGAIAGTHGVKGEVRIIPWADSPSFLCQFSTLYLDGKAMTVTSIRPDKTMVLCKFHGVDTVEAAMKLKGKVVSIDRKDVSLSAGQYFLADLMGLNVLDTATGSSIGQIVEVLTPPAHPVYVVKGGEKSYMIPAVPAFIAETDIEGGYVKVNLIEGLETDV